MIGDLLITKSTVLDSISPVDLLCTTMNVGPGVAWIARAGN